MAKSKRYTTSKRTTATRREAVKDANTTGVVKNLKVRHGGHAHRTVNAPKPLY